MPYFPNESDKAEIMRLVEIGFCSAGKTYDTPVFGGEFDREDPIVKTIMHAVAAMIVASKKPVCLECNGTGYNEIDSHGTKIRCVCTYEIGEEILGRR